MLQHNEGIHPPLELQGAILQFNNPPEFSQQIFSSADKQIDICKYWNLTYFQNDVAN